MFIELNQDSLNNILSTVKIVAEQLAVEQSPFKVPMKISEGWIEVNLHSANVERVQIRDLFVTMD